MVSLTVVAVTGMAPASQAKQNFPLAGMTRRSWTMFST
jgi:hypothetical protein